jgi:periplasmic copper chaperone A
MWIRKLTTNNLHALAMAGLAAMVLCTHADAAGPTIRNAWLRVLPAGLPAGGYFELHNGGTRTISLTGAASPGCGMLMLHKSETAGGMSRMTDVERVDAAPGQTITFAPGGYHLMCMDPKPMLKPGTHIPVTLRFADGSALTADFDVRAAR